MHEIVYMGNNNEISALLNLIDDPDEEVFGAVSARIVDYGSTIIPTLEHWWETIPNEQVQNRIEGLIHRLQLRELKRNFTDWKEASRHELLTGALLVSSFQYPDLATAPVITDTERLRRNIWLELNNYLTPLEQVNVFNNILYGYFGLKTIPRDENKTEDHLIHKVISSKKGSQTGNGLLYLVLCELLDLPIKAIQLPEQFILGYFKPIQETPGLQAAFFIDPSEGQIYKHRDIETYFKRIKEPLESHYLSPRSNIETIASVLEDLSKSYDPTKEGYKTIECLELARYLKY
jgi:regulator of sirC expression with transglutaminase-like and TPR domain